MSLPFHTSGSPVASVTPVLEGTSVLIGVVAALACLALLFAVVDVVMARRERDSLKAVPRDPAVASAVSEILIARDNFSQVVSRYEVALASSSRVMSASSEGAPDPTQVDSYRTDPGSRGFDRRLEDALTLQSGSTQSLEELTIEKDEARARLLDARRLWEMVRPGAGPAAASELWAGSGLLRAWHVGPIGFERIFFRFDHAVDSSCWAIHEAKRFRFGFALGAEYQRLAIFAVGASASQLGELSARAFRGSEAALRPGFVPLRFWRRIRRSDIARDASAALLGNTKVRDLIEGPSDEARMLVDRAYEAELGDALTARTVIPQGPALISVITKGPSVLFGVWSGRAPHPELRASSDHGAWQ